MELIGTNFNLTLGGWRLRLSFALEEVEEPTRDPQTAPPHRLTYTKPNPSHRVQN
ncbi:MAG TPA: hypothetical protein VIJ12_01630 [Candidatus Baltobacteraceae bacterium]